MPHESPFFCSEKGDPNYAIQRSSRFFCFPIYKFKGGISSRFDVTDISLGTFFEKTISNSNRSSECGTHSAKLQEFKGTNARYLAERNRDFVKSPSAGAGNQAIPLVL